MHEPILIIDCHAICHSVRYAYGGLTWEDRNTGVVFGFLDRMLTYSSKLDSTKFVFAWDSGKSYRKDLFPAYKRNRHTEERTVEETEIFRCAFKQFGELRQKVLPSLGFTNVFIQTGMEADDIIAKVVLENGTDHKLIIVSDDNDMFQLLHHADMWKIKKKELYKAEDFMDEFHIFPIQWIEVKELAGCSGDEVPGIPGIGIKRAIQHIHGELAGKYYQNIVYNEAIKERNRSLVKLPFEGTKVSSLTFPKLNLDTIFEVCEQYGMYSLLKGKRLETWKKFI